MIALIAIAIMVAAGFYLKNESSAKYADTEIYCSSDGSLRATSSVQAPRSYCIKLLTPEDSIHAGSKLSLSFSIVDDQGQTIKDFKVDREKLLHFIVVRHDLNKFQHVHPEFDTATGIFTLKDFSLPSAGQYRFFADFVIPITTTNSPDSSMNAVVSKDVTLVGEYQPETIGDREMTKTVDGYTVTLKTETSTLTKGENMLSFSITKNGMPVKDLQDYLGALGHAVVIRDTTLDYLHAHALQEPGTIQTGTIDFHVDFPTEGTYKAFVQFKHDEKLQTVQFVLPEVGGNVPSKKSPSMHGMDQVMTH